MRKLTYSPALVLNESFAGSCTILRIDTVDDRQRIFVPSADGLGEPLSNYSLVTELHA